MTKLTLLFKMLNMDQLDNRLPWKIMCCPMLKHEIFTKSLVKLKYKLIGVYLHSAAY